MPITPTGKSFRSLRRAVRKGYPVTQPTEKAKLRHQWYRRKLAWDKLRTALHQD